MGKSKRQPATDYENADAIQAHSNIYRGEEGMATNPGYNGTDGRVTKTSRDEEEGEYEVVTDIPLPNRITRQPRQHKNLVNSRCCLIVLAVCVIILSIISITTIALLVVNKSKDKLDMVTTPANMKDDREITTPTLPTQCLTAHNFTGDWRLDYTGKGNIANCDTKTLADLGYPWFRFTGDAGTRLLNRCPATNGSCGTHSALWSDESLPQPVGLAKPILVFGAWTSGCKEYQYNMFVMRCSTEKENDFVYWYLSDNNYECNIGFCSML